MLLFDLFFVVFLLLPCISPLLQLYILSFSLSFFLSSFSSPFLSLTVAQVNEYLDQMAMSNLKKERAGMKKAMQLLLRNTSAQEQKWLIRIIMKVRRECETLGIFQLS